MPDADINRCVELFRDSVLNNMAAEDALNLSDEMIERIFSQLDSGTVNQNSVIAVYVRKQMERSIRENFIYPRCKETLKDDT